MGDAASPTARWNEALAAALGGWGMGEVDTGDVCDADWATGDLIKMGAEVLVIMSGWRARQALTMRSVAVRAWLSVRLGRASDSSCSASVSLRRCCAEQIHESLSFHGNRAG